jgi:hypothetical protein
MQVDIIGHRLPLKTQSLLIEAFHDVANDKKAVDEMQRWLLKNKQTNDWKTTKATAEACYALLLQGTDFLATTSQTEITIGNKKLNPAENPETKIEAAPDISKLRGQEKIFSRKWEMSN